MDEKAKLMRCIIERILDEYNKGKTLDKKRIEQIKAECLRIHRIGIGHPSNSEILQYATEEEKKILIPILRKKPVRTISGVAVVAVMTSQKNALMENVSSAPEELEVYLEMCHKATLEESQPL